MVFYLIPAHVSHPANRCHPASVSARLSGRILTEPPTHVYEIEGFLGRDIWLPIWSCSRHSVGVKDDGNRVDPTTAESLVLPVYIQATLQRTAR